MTGAYEKPGVHLYHMTKKEAMKIISQLSFFFNSFLRITYQIQSYKPTAPSIRLCCAKRLG